jgi:hypothetical protein
MAGMGAVVIERLVGLEQFYGAIDAFRHLVFLRFLKESIALE